MKILIAHNAYQHSGGEDAVVNAELALLRSYGHDVKIYRRDNDELNSMSKANAAISAIWSRKSSSDIENLCDAFRPEVIHSHNTFPLISPAFYWMATRKHIPVLQTLHNFRLLCPQAMLLRNGKVCEDCVKKLPWRAVTRKCYRQSAVQSAVAASMLGAHRIIGTYRKNVVRYIALNAFCRDKFVEGGLPADRLHIKPNFVTSDVMPDWKNRKGGMFVGRLSDEKGIAVLIKAIKALNISSIQVIGNGPLENVVREAFSSEYLGFKEPHQVRKLLGMALFLLAPSICYETFGLVAIEAFSCGTPVIASRHGALAEIVKDGITGILFNPGDATDLAAKIAWAESHPTEMLRMGQAARAEYEAKYTPERNYQILMDIYQDAIMEARAE